jgi:predicted TIM-barrel fold metal-dependent hydrolase
MRSKLVVWVAVVCVISLVPSAKAQEVTKQGPPIIDMHLHALPAKGWPGGPSFFCPGSDFAPYDPKTKWDPDKIWEKCPNPLYPVASDDELLRQVLAVMDRYKIVLAAASGPLEYVEKYRQAAPKRILPGLSSSIASLGALDSLRGLIRKGEIAILGEVGTAIEGMSPEDERLEPYLALAEELDTPLAFHILSFQTPYMFPQNRATLNNPLLLEKLLIRHPRLRVYVMHAGWPMLNEMIALLAMYPEVYAEVAGINWLLPRKEFHRYLRGLVEAGFGKRIMFGSDAAMWPQVIGIGIEAIESADFLTEAQKRDILYNNAVRFLRLDPKSQVENKVH